MAAKTLKHWLLTISSWTKHDKGLFAFGFFTGLGIALLFFIFMLFAQSCTYEINVRVVQPDQLPVTVDQSQPQDTRSM